MLNEAKSEKLYFDDPQRWAIMMCLRPDVTLTDTQAARMQTALDAVYQYQQTVWCMSLNGSFKPEKHQNDWIDMNQLFHLADPAMRFLTADERIKQRCAKSDQARRILILNDFLANNCLAL